jgi:hypothetical protein
MRCELCRDPVWLRVDERCTLPGTDRFPQPANSSMCIGGVLGKPTDPVTLNEEFGARR